MATKKLFNMLCLVLPLACHAQDYKMLRRQGDSLKFSQNFPEAVRAYDKCIDLVLTGKHQVYDDEWTSLLASAMDANRSNPQKYSAMLYGTRAEKMSDKIATLKQMGVKYLFSFYEQYYSTLSINTSPYGCQIFDGNTYILVWAINDNVFMQAFNACNTYKPAKMNDKVLFDLMKHHTNDVVKEKITPMVIKFHHTVAAYNFEFVIDDRSVKKAPVDLWDFRTMEQNISPDEIKFIKKATIDKGDAVYAANIKTFFSQLFLRVYDDEKKYYDTINSGAERARIGKFD